MRDKWQQITTQVLDRHNDYIQVHFLFDESGFTLTDSGDTFQDLYDERFQPNDIFAAAKEQGFEIKFGVGEPSITATSTNKAEFLDTLERFVAFIASYRQD